ncbi:hypothetical protein WJX81_005114 [Elliptochloris bilobata]|uniref:Peptidyl-prolyl cis-trans isomerase n=1 Tax=Elliptochloris bilobata TaxID=381761 RepID=A0AAW1SHP1_9CHLO
MRLSSQERRAAQERSTGTSGSADPGMAQITGQPDLSAASAVHKPPAKEAAGAGANATRTRVFFDVAPFGEDAGGRLELELYNDIVPATAQNFKQLCTGEHGLGSSGKPLHYQGSAFHRIIPGFMAQGGDFTHGDGTGGESIYGAKFMDEGFVMKHDAAGVLSMANAGPDTNGSQFFITFAPAPHLDGKHVVFGKVVSGMDLLRRIERLGTQSGRPTQRVVIAASGELPAQR